MRRVDPERMSNGRIRASSAGGRFPVLFFGVKNKVNWVASARLLERSAATGRVIVAPVKPTNALQKKPDEINRK